MSTNIYEAIKDDLGYLKLSRAAERFAPLADEARTEKWSHVEYLRRVMAEEVSATRDRRLAARLRFAHFPFRKSVADFDFEFQPSVDPKVIADLASLRFVAEGMPVLFLGQPGCGKTHLAVALAIAAVEAGYRGYFVTAADMVASLRAAYLDGTHTIKMRTYTGPSVLVIDDVGITPFDREQANAFYQVVNRRYELGSSTIVTTNRGLPSWAELFGGDPVVAGAVIDRLMHRAVVFNIKGRSWRMKEHQALVDSVRDSYGSSPPEPPEKKGKR
jgi:DNA replication protein DnaC